MQSKPLLRTPLLLAVLIPLLGLTGCFGTGDGKERIPGTPPAAESPDDDLILVFSDEFNEGTMPSAEKWNFETGYGDNDSGWGNNEWQLYTDSPDNVRVENGNLVIEARCDTPPCGSRDGTVTSARLTTQGKFDFRYGRVEARIKPPVGEGSWPAFWSLGANFPQVGWPFSGEIDFMEMFQGLSDPNTTHFTMHWCDENLQIDADCFPQGRVFISESRRSAQSLGLGFHVFSADWTAEKIVGKIDGVTYFELDINPATMEEFLREFFLILNVAMGGTLGSDNQLPSGNETWPQTMLVDYVRVYQREEDIGGGDGVLIDFEDDPGSYSFINFEGGVGSVIGNPQSNDLNNSAQVAQFQKFGGMDFAGSVLDLELNVPANSRFTAKVWSQRAVQVLFKLEDGGAGVETTVIHGGSGWETLEFDTRAASGAYTGITFIFDLGTLGDAENNPADWTFYVDDIELVPDPNAGLAQIDLPITFDAPMVNYALTDFLGASTTLTNDPDDADNRVASTAKFTGAEAFAGTTMSTPDGLASRIPFTASTKTIGVRVYSPDAGIPVRLKAEALGGSPFVETDTVTTVANAWETLVFDFDDPVDAGQSVNLSVDYRLLSIFFNVGTDGDTAGDKTYLWDDVEFGVPVPDTEPPMVSSATIASNNTNPTLAKAGDTITVSLVANEPIMMPTVMIGGVASTTVTGGGINWQATATVDAGADNGPVAIEILPVDLAGNAGATVTMTTNGSMVTIDTMAPLPVIEGAPMAFTTLDPIMLTFEFGEAVTGFTRSDITVTGGVVSPDPVTVVDESTYTTSVTPMFAGDLTIGVAAGAVNDLAGNASAMAVPVTVMNGIDASVARLTTVSISSSNANPAFARVGDVVTIDMVADRDIQQPTVMIAGAPATVTDAGDMLATTWQASRTMLMSDTDAVVSFQITFDDLAGDPGLGTTATTDSSSVTFDKTGPTLTITSSPASVAPMGTVTATFAFDEDVSGFELADITITNGTAVMLVEVDAANYTADITSDGGGDIVIDVAAAVAIDAAGNDNDAASLTVPLSAYQMAWSDDFSGAMLDPLTWSARTDADCPPPCDGDQSYLSERVSVADGMLKIEARNVARGGGTFTSGLVDTLGKQQLTYGKVEIDAIIPGTQGTLPVLRLLPVSEEYGPWPASGQIDIVNAPEIGVLGNDLIHALRYGLPEPEDTLTQAIYTPPFAPNLALHTYAIEWNAEEIRWYVDGVNVATQTEPNWYAYYPDEDGALATGEGSEPFDQPFYLVLAFGMNTNAAVGTYPQTLAIEAVRVFECNNPADPALGTGCITGDPQNVLTAAPAPFTETLDVYLDAPQVVDFFDPENPGTPVSAALEPGTIESDGGVTVTTNIAAADGGNTVWNAAIMAPAGTGGVFIGAQDNGAASGYFDLSGAEAAGELLFRMRVNAATVSEVAVGLDGVAGTGTVSVAVTPDSEWRDHAVRIGDVVTDSVMAATDLDLATIASLFTLEASNGTIDLDLDDIRVKVACRDTNGCGVEPKLPVAESTYTEDFEGMTASDPFALVLAGWKVFANVYNGAGDFKFGYGPFGAPNNGMAFSAVRTGEGGPSQGVNQLSAFNDYNCCDPGGTNEGHFNGTDRVETLLFQERPVVADDVGSTLEFSFDAKAGDITTGTATAEAFVKTLGPSPNFDTTSIMTLNTTALNADWTRYSVSLFISADVLGHTLQFGFSNTSSNFNPSNNFYDNLEVVRIVRD